MADQLFNRFLWTPSNGPHDENWPCEQPEIHGPKRQKKAAGEPDSAGDPAPSESEAAGHSVTHPTDMVFYYDEPYSNHRTYINCDLKSYAKATIQKSQVRKAVDSLARSLTCLEKSATWRSRYVSDDKTALYAGMLFVYNHDGEYNQAFDELLADLNLSRLDIPRNSKIVVLGPRDIFWLDNVSDQVARMRGDGLMGPPEHTRFFYPPLVLAKNVQPSARAATIEMLTGPWIVLKHRLQDSLNEAVVVFYRGKGERIEEFSLLIDYLMFHGLIDQETKVDIFALEPHKEAKAFFAQAIEDYIRRYEGGDEIAQLLKAVTFQSITHVRRTFSTVEIGMSRGK